MATIILPLQTAPSNKIQKSALNEADTLIRKCVKNKSCLPADTLLYSPRKYRGFGIVRARSNRRNDSSTTATPMVHSTPSRT